MKPWEIVSEVLRLVSSTARVRMATEELDKIAEKKIIELGGTPYNKGYKPEWAKTQFPATLCISINDELCHGIPGKRILLDGDIVSFDVGVKKDGLCGDGSLTIGIGNVSDRDERLLRYGKQTLMEGIKIIKAGIKISEIARVMEQYAGLRGYTINHVFGGHGIGKKMHEEPFISHVTWPEESKMGKAGEYILKEGQMICLEPILTYEDKFGFCSTDGWTWKTRDGKKSCIFEHQILVEKDGYKILTNHI
jgi:methionyl aminopeptidase